LTLFFQRWHCVGLLDLLRLQAEGEENQADQCGTDLGAPQVSVIDVDTT